MNISNIVKFIKVISIFDDINCLERSQKLCKVTVFKLHVHWVGVLLYTSMVPNVVVLKCMSCTIENKLFV